MFACSAVASEWPPDIAISRRDNLSMTLLARELRRERDETDRPRVQEPLEQVQVGVAAGRRRVDPEAQGRQERPFEMRAQDARPVRLSRHLAEGGEELLFGGRDERGEIGSDAGPEERFSCLPISVRVGGEEVDARRSR